jgi:hypothetical protein
MLCYETHNVRYTARSVKASARMHSPDSNNAAAPAQEGMQSQPDLKISLNSRPYLVVIFLFMRVSFVVQIKNRLLLHYFGFWGQCFYVVQKWKQPLNGWTGETGETGMSYDGLIASLKHK